MVIVWTGRIGEGGQTEVNTTVTQASTAIGKVLAPTKKLVFGHKSFMGDARFKRFDPINDKQYQKQYIKLLQDRYLPNKDLFRALLERDEITITCFCGKDKHYCHRFIIVNYILPKCAEHFGIAYSYQGER